MGGRAGKGGNGGLGGNSRKKKEPDMSWTDVNVVASALVRYGNMDRWNRHTAYAMGFNDDAMGLVEDLAKGDYGLASTIAQQAVSRPNWAKYGAYFSAKQAYVMAKAAIDNKIVRDSVIFSSKVAKDAAADAARQHAAKVAKWESYSSGYTKSSTKVAVGSKVWDSKGRSGTISNIITKSSGYVTVQYDDGTTGKQMAFNLKGSDGNPLKKRPKP